MSFLLCMDESGHDHKSAPFEVRGGICVHASRVWSLTQAVQRAEVFAFGDHLSNYRSARQTDPPELKGKKLLKTKRFTLAAQDPGRLASATRQELCRKLLAKGVRGDSPTRAELTAFGKASILFCEELLRVLIKHGVLIFASRIPRGTNRPSAGQEGLIRKDQFFLFERFHRFLSTNDESGILILDESDESLDRKYVASLNRLFNGHEVAKTFTATIVPSPFFVASDMHYLIQAADIVLYMLSWGFRVKPDDPAPARPELEALFGAALKKMVYRRRSSSRGKPYTSYSVFDVHDPWDYRIPQVAEKEKEGNAFGVVFRAPLGRASDNILREKDG